MWISFKNNEKNDDDFEDAFRIMFGFRIILALFLFFAYTYSLGRFVSLKIQMAYCIYFNYKNCIVIK